MNEQDLHARLIGRQGGRASLNTPALIVDLDALEANIARMAMFAQRSGLALRPHAKTHKSVDIATMQLRAGAVGVCCAKLGEAEALAPAVESILITSPVVPPPAVERLRALHERLKDLRVVVDHPDNVARLGHAFKDASRPLRVLVDVDPGIHRTGVASPNDAASLAETILAEPGLDYLGVQFYCGREQHLPSYDERRQTLLERCSRLRSTLDALNAIGAVARVVTGGGTGTHVIDAELGLLNELQAGSYVFMDRQYLDCDISGGAEPPYQTSLFIDARIISANTSGLATLDAGFKAMASDAGAPDFHQGAPAGATFAFMGDEHGAIRAKGTEFRLGDRVTLTTPHCDPTVNLYDAYHVVRGETLVDIWPVSARGRSR